LHSLVSAAVHVSFLIASSVSAIAETCYPSLAVSSGSGQGTPSLDEEYAAHVASTEKAHLNVALSAVSTDIRAQGITDVAEKIVFDGWRKA